MADDGMFLNFSTADAVSSLTRTPKFKGGSWRERMRLKKNAKSRGLERQQEQKSGGGNEQAYKRATRNGTNTQTEDFSDPRPSKKRRESGEFVPSTQRESARPNNDATIKRPLGNREVISSLFSYNPAPQTVENSLDKEEEDATPAKPSNAPLPDGIDTFTSLGLSPVLAAHLLTKMSFKTPTAIQKAAMLQLLKEDSDAFIQSETGSGKTLAYLLPLVQRLMTMSEAAKNIPETARDTSLHRHSGLFAIVLAPTRELCKQISVVLERLLGCAHHIVAGTVIGGEKKKSEKARLRKGLNILVATPGRLVDHLENTKSLDVSNVRYLVLDEGDRLMDLGFEEDITKIVKALDGKKRKNSKPGLPERRITMLCSATLKMNVQKLGDISLKDAVLIKGDAEEENSGTDASNDGIDSAFLAPAQLKQSYIVTASKLRLVTLTALLRRTFARKGSVMKAIVFVSCADSVEFHFKTLTRNKKAGQEDEKDVEGETAIEKQVSPEELSDAISAAPLLSTASNPLTVYKLHGSLPQATRTSIVKSFAATSNPSLLIATDVAARGLDLPNLDLVIEYDPAFSTDDHLHRIGRTARLGRDGRAVIFLLPGKEEGYVEVLKKSYKTDGAGGSNVTSNSAEETLKKGFSPVTGVVNSQKDWEINATNFQLDIERWVLEDSASKELAKKAFQSHIRAYATHIASERKWFDIKELHLGHLAKAFGLRDPPGKVNVAGVGRKGAANRSRSTVKANEGRKRKAGDGAFIDDTVAKPVEVDDTVEYEEAAKKMREMVRNRKKMMGATADEFNVA